MWMAYLYRLRKGRFEPSRDDASYFFFQTDLARVTINRDRGIVKVTSDAGSREFPFWEIQRLDFAFEAAPALAEEWLNGFDLWDYFKSYRDTVNWHHLSLVTAAGEKVPIYSIGQYEPREPLSAWWFNLQVRVLHRFGLFKSGDEIAVEVLERIQAEFREGGKDLGLVTMPRA